MAFGIPGSESASSGEFLGRLQFDARTGFWLHTTRFQSPEGRWEDSKSEEYTDPTFLMDFASLEVGYAKIASPPTFLLVPYGEAYPTQPQELNAEGKKAFSPAARVKVMGQQFGDSSPRYFLLASKTGLPAMEEAFMTYLKSAEAAEGKVPVVKATTRAVEVETPRGKSKFRVPVFTIQTWVDRPEALGARLVNAPAQNSAPAAAPAPKPNGHVPPPAGAAPKSDLPF